MCVSQTKFLPESQRRLGGLRRTKLIQARHPPASLSSANGDKSSLSDEKGQEGCG